MAKAKADKQRAVAAHREAEEAVEQTKTELEQLKVKALVTGQVLQVNVRPGEYVSTPPRAPLIVLGNTEQLHVRVDIDENDIPRFDAGSAASATPRGRPAERIPLEIVRIEPFVIPKCSLTGENTERVDTRVLQVIYAVKSREIPLYVGQQLDVYIKDSPQSATSRTTPGQTDPSTDDQE